MVDTIAESNGPKIPAPSNTVPWGFHAIMDCRDCELAKIQDLENIKSWLTSLSEAIEFTVTTAPVVSSTSVGYNVVQFADTDSIDATFVDDLKQIYLDVFAHGPFDPAAVETSIKEFFGSSTVVSKVLIPRNALA